MLKLKNIKLVIVSGSEKVQNFLYEIFVKLGANVVLCGYMNQELVHQLQQNVTADVILIDMDDAYEEDDDALDSLLDNVDIPILFHENIFHEVNDDDYEHGFSPQEIDKLAIKLAELVNENDSHAEIKPGVEADAFVKSNDDTPVEQESSEPYSLENSIESGVKKAAALSDRAGDDGNNFPQKALNVWVLGASIGGPEAVKRFLARLPAELPVAFVLAQHLGDGFVELLASQLDSSSTFKVKEGTAGDILRHGEVTIVPVENHMVLDSQGRIKLTEKSWEGHYKPSIDSVINDVTNYYRQHSGVIIFSGMGADGTSGCQKFAQQYKGKVWAQSTDSCVISSMPDSVRGADLVSYSGSPEALALKIVIHYMGKDSYIV